MCTSRRKHVRNLGFMIAAGCIWIAGSALATPALAQTICNSTVVINFPNGDNLNRVVGNNVVMSLAIHNGPSLNGGVDDDQTFAVADFFPSCLNVSGGVCTLDQGETAGPPPPIQYVGSMSTDCPVAPTVDTSNPFDIKFNFSPALTLPNLSTCTITFTVHVAERGDLSSTPTNIQQLAGAPGVCGSTLTSSVTGSAAITLTCPPCDDGNVCTTDTCNASTAQCQHSTPPDCNDNNPCTNDACTGPNPGNCSHSTPPDCNDNNPCTNDACTGPNPGNCSHSTPPDCNDNNPCTNDACTGPNPGNCSHSTPPSCDDSNPCTLDTCTGPNPGDCNHSTPPNCDDHDVCTHDVCTGPGPNDCSHTPESPLPPTCAAECRMTGGQNFDVVDAEFDENGKVYTTGGQIGAPNGSGCCDLPPKGKCVAGKCTGGLNGGQACVTNDNCPNDPGRDSHCPWGDWEHNHHSGADDSGSVTSGSFAFHSGTAASPDAAFIKSVLCADPGWCVQARPAPFKQIFWEGTGVFHNAKTDKNKDIPLPLFAACGANQPVPYSKSGGTLHYYKAHVGDFGEPAGIFQKPADACHFDETCINPEPNQVVEISREDNVCPSALGDVCLVDAVNSQKETLEHPLCQAQTCSECPDLYEIEIHCTEDPSSPVAYRVSHFIREGNFQLHPPVGDSCNPSCGNGVCETGVTGTAETCETCPTDCGPCS